MAPRPTWQGHLRLSLVTCPVALYTATSPAGDVHFNLLHKETHNRIKMIPTDPDIGPVERADLVKGYEYEKGEYIVVTQDEIDSVRLESTRTIDIERFVDATDIDRLYWDNPYFLAPDGKLALEPRDNGMMACSLRSNREVRDPATIFDDIADRKPDAAMIAIAEKIIEQKEGPFDPSEFN